MADFAPKSPTLPDEPTKGDRLRFARESAELSLEAVGEALSITGSAVRRHGRGIPNAFTEDPRRCLPSIRLEACQSLGAHHLHSPLRSQSNLATYPRPTSSVLLALEQPHDAPPHWLSL